MAIPERRSAIMEGGPFVAQIVLIEGWTHEYYFPIHDDIPIKVFTTEAPEVRQVKIAVYQRTDRISDMGRVIFKYVGEKN